MKIQISKFLANKYVVNEAMKLNREGSRMTREEKNIAKLNVIRKRRQEFL